MAPSRKKRSIRAPAMTPERDEERSGTRRVRSARDWLRVIVRSLDHALQQAQKTGARDLVPTLRDARAAADHALSALDHERTDPTPPAAAPPPPETAPRMARVLVVDDEPSMVAALGRCLREHHVAGTTDAGEALSWIVAGQRFDVILCDVTMPAMSGPELYAAVESAAPDQIDRFVFLTAGALDPAGRAFLDAVPNVVLEKPFDLEALREVVRRCPPRP